MSRISSTKARTAAAVVLAVATGGAMAACGVASAADQPAGTASATSSTTPVPDAVASSADLAGSAEATVAGADTPADAQAALLAAIDQTLGAASFAFYSYGQDQGPDETLENCTVILADSVQQTTADLWQESGTFTFADGKCSDEGLAVFDASQAGYYSPNTHEGPVVIYQVPADVAYKEQLAKTGLSALRDGVAAASNVAVSDGGYVATLPAGAFFGTDDASQMSAATLDQLPSVTTPVDVTFTLSPAGALATAGITIPTGDGRTSHFVHSWTDLGGAITFAPYFDAVGGIDLPAWVQADRADEVAIHMEGPAGSLAAANQAYADWSNAYPTAD